MKAIVKEVIYTKEQKYVDPDKRYAHNDLYPCCCKCNQDCGQKGAG